MLTRLKLGGSIYTIVEADGHDLKGNYGETDHHAKTIKMNTQHEGHRYSEEMLNTLIHEILHVAWRYSRFDTEGEEVVVTGLADRLSEAFIINPDLVTTIRTLANKARKNYETTD